MGNDEWDLREEHLEPERVNRDTCIGEMKVLVCCLLAIILSTVFPPSKSVDCKIQEAISIRWCFIFL